MRVVTKQTLGIIAAIIIALLIVIVNPLHLAAGTNTVLSVAVCMIVLWVTEALPMPVVALFPLVVFPLTSTAKIEEVAAPYANPVIFLFMGGFMIGLAIEKWNLHKRIALNIVKFTGTGSNRIILGFILSTGFLSMWLSNTATTMMMFPIALSVIAIMEDHKSKSGHTAKIAVPIMLSIAYASNFGGMATIIGTPPNVAYVAFLEKKYGFVFHFSDWLIICTPLAFLLMIALYLLMTKVLYRSKNDHHDEAASEYILSELKSLGRITAPELRVLIIFCATALLWITKDIINNNITAFKLDDNIIALSGAIALFACPSGDEKYKSNRLLDWSDTSKMAWGILLLFGGGIALAAQLEKAGLIEQLGNWLSGFAGSGGFVLILGVTVLSIFISEVMSNVAQVIVFAPVMSAIADAMGINPILLGLPMTLAASAASMMPMGTPPNAIVFGSGKLKLKDMVVTGFCMNIIAIILISLFSWFLIPLLIKAVH